jgi:hypothetical protein
VVLHWCTLRRDSASEEGSKEGIEWVHSINEVLEALAQVRIIDLISSPLALYVDNRCCTAHQHVYGHRIK